MSQQYGLGRGLASLIPPKKKDEAAKAAPFRIEPISRPATPAFSDENASASAAPAPTAAPAVSVSGSQSREVPIGDIVPNPHQPRLHFDEAKLEELEQSIKEHGVLQPLVVSPLSGGKYELIAGERRLQASKRAGLAAVPVVVKDASEQEKLELAIIENIQRHNLNPIEEAKAFLRLVDEFGLQQDDVAKKMGKSRSAVANTMRLLHLPIEIQRAVAEGKISEGHAKARAEWPWLEAMFVWHLQPDARADEPVWGFALWSREGSETPAWRALAKANYCYPGFCTTFTFKASVRFMGNLFEMFDQPNHEKQAMQCGVGIWHDQGVDSRDWACAALGPVSLPQNLSFMVSNEVNAGRTCPPCEEDYLREETGLLKTRVRPHCWVNDPCPGSP